MFKRIMVVLISLSILAVAGCNTEKKANEHFKRAREFRVKYNFTRAIDEYQQIIIKYPKSLLVQKARKLIIRCEEELETEKLFNLANVLLEKKFNDAALFILKGLLDKNPDSYLAEDIRKKVNVLTSNRAEDLFVKAAEYHKKYNYSKAIELYKELIKDFPYNKNIEKAKASLAKAEQELVQWKSRQSQRDAQKAKLEQQRQRELAEAKKQKKKQEKKQKAEDAIRALIERTR